MNRTETNEAKGQVVWGYEIPLDCLSDFEKNYLNNLPAQLPSLQWLWNEMDRVWDSYGLSDSKKTDRQKIAAFYRHPVWLLNGIFTACDPLSCSHRQAIAQYLVSLCVKNIADYGGGFGELAFRMASLSKDVLIDVIEPFPAPIAVNRMKGYDQIHFLQDISSGGKHYEAVVAQDVLEHVEDPIGLACQLARMLDTGGLIIFANCFYPVIKCHLPATFHLRFTFKYVMKKLGLEYIGCVPQAEHALVFRKNNDLCDYSARRAEILSKIFGKILIILANIGARIRG